MMTMQFEMNDILFVHVDIQCIIYKKRKISMYEITFRFRFLFNEVLFSVLTSIRTNAIYNV